MVASRRTIEDVGEVVLRHVSPEVATALLTDLASVSGNASFRQTIVGLRAAVTRAAARSERREEVRRG